MREHTKPKVYKPGFDWTPVLVVSVLVVVATAVLLVGLEAVAK